MEFPTSSTFVSSRRRRAASLACAAAIALSWAQGAHAADKLRAASAPASKTAVLSQAQLRECMTQKDTLRERNDAILKGKASLVAAKAEIDRTGAEIADLKATLDQTKKELVDAYNEKIVARNALIDDYQARAGAYNKDVEDIQAAQDGYATACSNRRYDDRDLGDIQRKK